MEAESAGLKQLASKVVRPPPETRATTRRRMEERGGGGVAEADGAGSAAQHPVDVSDADGDATEVVAAGGDGGARARANAAALMPEVRSVGQSHADMFFKSMNEKKPQTGFDRKMCVVMGSSERRDCCAESRHVETWRYGGAAVRRQPREGDARGLAHEGEAGAEVHRNEAIAL